MNSVSITNDRNSSLGLTVFRCAVSFPLNIKHSFPFFEANTQLELTMANNSTFLIINTELPCLKLGFPLFKYKYTVNHGVKYKRSNTYSMPGTCLVVGL